MKNSFTFFVVFCVVFVCCSARKLPDYIKPCSVSDPNLSQCLTQQANDVIPLIKHGDKKFRLPDLAPFIIENLKTKFGRLDIELTNLKIFGLDQAVVKSITYDQEAETLTLKVFVPDVKIKSDYEMKGMILVLNVEGKGPMELSISEAIFNEVIKFENLRSDSTEKIKFLESNLDYSYQNSSLHFDNLFNGNQRLAEPVNKLLNDERETLLKDFKPIFVETINSVLKSIVKQMFNGFHFSELFRV